MRKHAIGLLAATLLLVSLAGCAAPGPAATPADGSAADPGSTGSEAPSKAPGGQGSGAPARDPIAWEPVFLVDAATGNGTLNATFSLDIRPTLGNVAWTLDLGDGLFADGKTLPATIEHAYGVGNFTARYAVAAGGEVKEAAMAIVVAAAALPPEPIVETYTAEVLISAPWLLWDVTGEAPATELEAVAWASYENGLPNQDGHAFTVPVGVMALDIVSEALPGQVHDPVGELCGPDDALEFDTDMFLFLADGTFVASSGGCGTGERIALEVPVPGDYVIVQLGFTGANMEIPTTITMQPG